MTPTVNSYFSGAGLMDLGLERGGLAIQQSFEIDRDCCATLRANATHEVVQGDITRKEAFADKECDVMVATYPCTRYSPIGDIHGVRTGDDLYLHFFRHFALRKPEVYALENVPGMKKFPVVMEAMTRLGDYYTQVFCPVKSETWLPQRRSRLIVIGSKRRFSWRLPTGRRVSLASVLENVSSMAVPDYVFKRIRGEYRDRPIVSDAARDDLAPTCVAHYSKDLSTRLVVDRSFPGGLRPYTVREYARLQGVPGDKRTMLSAGVANQVIRLCRALRGIKPDPGSGLTITLSDDGIVIDASGLAQTSSGGSGIWPMKIIDCGDGSAAVYDNFLLAQFLGGPKSGTIVAVALPTLLQRQIYALSNAPAPDSGSGEGGLLTYVQPQIRTNYHANTPNPSVFYVEAIWEPYERGDIIFAFQPAGDGTGVTVPLVQPAHWAVGTTVALGSVVTWQDINVDGRIWRTETQLCDGNYVLAAMTPEYSDSLLTNPILWGSH